MHVAAIIAAGGRGLRLGAGRPKQFLEIGGRSILEMSLAALAASDRISEIVVALGTKSTFKLLEALAGAIGAKIQELYPRASVAIELEKLAPPCPGVPAACGVRLYLPAREP